MDDVESVEEDVAEFFGGGGFFGVHRPNKQKVHRKVNSVAAEGGRAFFQYLEECVLEFFWCSVDFVEK